MNTRKLDLSDCLWFEWKSFIENLLDENYCRNVIFFFVFFFSLFSSLVSNVVDNIFNDLIFIISLIRFKKFSRTDTRTFQRQRSRTYVSKTIYYHLSINDIFNKELRVMSRRKVRVFS
jgi:hypothetical protein